MLRTENKYSCNAVRTAVQNTTVNERSELAGGCEVGVSRQSHREQVSAITINTDRSKTGEAGLCKTRSAKPTVGTFLKIDNRKSFGYGSGYGYKYDSENIKKRQINKAPMERWGMLELIHKSGIRLSRVEKENLLIFGDIRGYEWADYERQKLIYEFEEER